MCNLKLSTKSNNGRLLQVKDKEGVMIKIITSNFLEREIQQYNSEDENEKEDKNTESAKIRKLAKELNKKINQKCILIKDDEEIPRLYNKELLHSIILENEKYEEKTMNLKNTDGEQIKLVIHKNIAEIASSDEEETEEELEIKKNFDCKSKRKLLKK